MHILFLTDNFPPERNAAASRVYERARYWVEWGHRVTVLTCAPNFPEGKVYPGYANRLYQTEIIDGIKVVRLLTFIARNEGVVLRVIDFMSFMLTAFTAGLFQKRPDVVVATSPQFFAAVGGWALSAVRRLPFVFELSDLWPASVWAVGAMRESFLLRLLERLELFLYRRSSAVVALTDAFKKDLIRRGTAADKIAVILNGVDLRLYSPRSKNQDLAKEFGINDGFVIGYIGTHGMAHDLGKVLDAAERLQGKNSIRFLFVGAGAEREALLKNAHERNLQNVIFVPPQPKERMPDFWSLCDVALVHLKDTPVFETVIPSKMFEAMAMGLPLLLVSPRGEASTIVHDEKVGMWVPAGEPVAFVDSVLQLAENAERTTAYAAASLACATGHSRERQAALMLEVLEKVATRRDAGKTPHIAS